MNTHFLILTNSNPNYKGLPLAIRKDLIMTVNSNMTQRDDGTKEMVTYLFGPPHGTWEVSETYEEVMQQLNH